jgi:hypothetical protein
MEQNERKRIVRLDGKQTISQNNRKCVDCKYYKKNWFSSTFLDLFSDGKCKKYSVPDGFTTSNWCVVLRTIESSCSPMGIGWKKK